MSRSVRPTSNQEDRVNKVMLLAVASGVVALASGTALAGPPAWCKGASSDEPRMSALGSKASEQVLKAFDTTENQPNTKNKTQHTNNKKARTTRNKQHKKTEDEKAEADTNVNLG